MNVSSDSDDEDGWDDDGADFGQSPDDSEGEPTVPCPYCRREILEDSPWCPACERYISDEDHVGPSRPAWVIVTALICLGIAIWLVFAAF